MIIQQYAVHIKEGALEKMQKDPKAKRLLDQLDTETSQQRKQKEQPVATIENSHKTFDNKLRMTKEHPIPM